MSLSENIFLVLLFAPFAWGLVTLFIPNFLKWAKEIIAVSVAFFTALATLTIFFYKPLYFVWDGTMYLRIDNLSSFILLAISLFGILIAIYSCKFMEGKPRLNEYYAYFLWTLGGAYGVAMANDLIILLLFWGFLGFTLYMLAGMGGEEAAAAAKKTFIIVGGTDALMILGVGILWTLSGTLELSSLKITLNSTLPIVAFLCLASGAFAKAGAMPFHSWIPDVAEHSPAAVSAYLPASLDKLLGIYFLARICLDIFIITKPIQILLLIVGAVTIIAAVMMALVQHNLKRLLGYCAVSQVGYMVLGIGTGNPVGIAGGIFHMLNHAIYKACLFLTGGAVEKQTGTAELDKLGGLAKFMPLTFISCLIAALSISGIPPLNGFFSKWMIYQGVIELGKSGDKLWIIWLVAAMFGSALTLASFLKLLHATFLGANRPEKAVKEVSWLMWLPTLTLAALCITFGIFAIAIPLQMFIFPALTEPAYLGFWDAGPATGLILLGLAIGAILYLLGNMKGVREDSAFMLGEETTPEAKISGVDFYNTIKELPLLKTIYKWAEQKFFDIYDQGKNLVFGIGKILSILHSGLLHTYLAWCLIGLGMLLFFLVF